MLAVAVGGGMDQPKGVARLAEGRERYMRAWMEIQFDSGRWLAQFPDGDAAAVRRVLLAAAPLNAPTPGAQGMELVRQLTLDPVYQLK